MFLRVWLNVQEKTIYFKTVGNHWACLLDQTSLVIIGGWTVAVGYTEMNHFPNK
jgi:hypothetical protein